MSDNLADPLLVLLRRHEEGNVAYDAAAAGDIATGSSDMPTGKVK